jgi:hypothetical protein
MSIYAAKESGKNLGWIRKILLPDGEVMQITADNPREAAKYERMSFS